MQLKIYIGCILKKKCHKISCTKISPSLMFALRNSTYLWRPNSGIIRHRQLCISRICCNKHFAILTPENVLSGRSHHHPRQEWRRLHSQTMLACLLACLLAPRSLQCQNSWWGQLKVRLWTSIVKRYFDLTAELSIRPFRVNGARFTCQIAKGMNGCVAFSLNRN